MTKNLFSEVFADLTMKIGEDKANEVFEKFDDMEKAIKFSNADLLKSDEMENLIFPTNTSEFKNMLNVIKSFVEKSNQKEASDAILAVLNTLPSDKVVSSYSPLREIDIISKNRFERIKETPSPESEPKLPLLKKVIDDFIFMNEIDHDIYKEIDNLINYFVNRIRENELRSDDYAKECNFDKSVILSKIKLASYYNLNSGNNFKLSSPEIVCKGNRCAIELSFYNAFLVGIIKITNKWEHKIFDLLDKETLAKNSQFDVIFKAIKLSIVAIVNEKMNSFIKSCQDMAKVKYTLTDAEKVALDEMYLNLLNKKVPMSLR